MANIASLKCDGCGQDASPEHIARRLQHLEWATRYRPVHIQTLLLGGFCPGIDEDFVYSPAGEFHGEASFLLDVAGITPTGKSPELVLSEFQRAGFFLTHVLECPFDGVPSGLNLLPQLLAQRLPSVTTRIKRSLKPKRLAFISSCLMPLAQKCSAAELGCALTLNEGGPFAFDGPAAANAVARLRYALSRVVPAG